MLNSKYPLACTHQLDAAKIYSNARNDLKFLFLNFKGKNTTNKGSLRKVSENGYLQKGLLFTILN